MKLWEVPTRSDKGTPGHGYLEVYESLLAPIRWTVSDVLEVGVDAGHSIQLWRDYFGGKTHVYGYDIHLAEDLACDREGLTECDAYTVAAAEGTGQLNLFIDDGPHTLESMLFAVEHYLPKVEAGGLFVVEDVPSADWFADLYAAVPAALQRFAYGIDRVAHGRSPYADDRLFVVDLREIREIPE